MSCCWDKECGTCDQTRCRDWRDDPMVKSSPCSYRGSEVGSQNPPLGLPGKPSWDASSQGIQRTQELDMVALTHNPQLWGSRGRKTAQAGRHPIYRVSFRLIPYPPPKPNKHGRKENSKGLVKSGFFHLIDDEARVSANTASPALQRLTQEDPEASLDCIVDPITK